MITVKPTWVGRFQIARIDRSPFEREAGCDDCGLDEIEDVLVEELRVRRGLAKCEEPHVDGLSVNAWLKVSCYQVIQALLTVDEGQELFARLTRHNRFVRGTRKDNRDVFQEGIVAMFARNPQAVKVKDRERLAAPMWHGFRHYIPPALLDGFNRQYPAHVREEHGWRENIEPALTGWVIEQRIYSQLRDCPLEASRGTYPAAVEQKVEGAIRSVNDANGEWPG